MLCDASLHAGEVCIPAKKSARILGVIVDTTMSMEKHVSNSSFNYLDRLSLTFSKGWERSKKLEESLLESLEIFQPPAIIWSFPQLRQTSWRISMRNQFQIIHVSKLSATSCKIIKDF